MHSTLIAGLLTALVTLSPGARAAPRDPVVIQFLNVSDWHGQLDPLNITGVGDVGGAAVLSTYWRQERAAQPNTLTLTGGDAFGATPPLSNFFGDEPAVLALGLMGLQVDTLGNHNFDAGLTHLQDLIDLASYAFVSANLDHLDGNLDGVDAFSLFDVGGVSVAVIGLTNPEAATLVRPGALGDIVVTDPVTAANRARAQALARGAKVVVAVVHMGITSFDAAGLPEGPLVDFANAVGGFDVIFGDHTDVLWSGTINGQLVIENRSKGVTYARTQLTVDPGNGRVLARSVAFVTPRSAGVTPDPAIVSLLAPYRQTLSAIYDTVIATASGVFVRGSNIERRQEVAIGNLIADALRLRYSAQLALTNSGGIRAALPSSYAPADQTLRRTAAGYLAGPPYDIVTGDVFTVLPFGNECLTRTVTGAQLWAALENGVSKINADGSGADGRFPQISGFAFTYSANLPAGARVLSVTLPDGTPIDNDVATTYSFVTNDFVNEGGDFYSMLRDGQGVSRELMAEVVYDYIRSVGALTPTTDGRITRVTLP